MRAALLLLSVLSIVFSQAIDFNSGAARVPGTDSFWLEDGEWVADITGRDDLVSSVIELSFGVAHPGYDCYYSVWTGETQVSQGTFNNVANNIIPLLSGSVDASTASTLVVKTNGCVLGRYAVPYTFGDGSGFNRDAVNAPSVEIVDISPGSAALTTYNASNPADFAFVPLTIPDNFNDWVARLNYVRVVDADCQFSSQACYGGPNEQFWTTNTVGSTVNFFSPTSSDKSDTLLFELSVWSSSPWTVTINVCNQSNSGPACLAANSPGAWLPVSQARDASSLYQEGSPSAAASGVTQLKYTRTFFEFPSDANLESALLYQTSTPAVVFPYAKVWDLSITDDTRHQVTKIAASADCIADYLYNFQSAVCSGGVTGWGIDTDGTLFLGENWQSSSSYFAGETSPNLYFGAASCTWEQQNWYSCYTSTYPFSTISNVTGTVEAIQTTTGTAPGTSDGAQISTTVPAASFTDGFIQLYGIDAGVPYMVAAGDKYPAPGLSNYHHVRVQTTGGQLGSQTTASFWDFGIQYPSAQAYLRGLGSVYAGHLEAGLLGGYKVTLQAEAGYSMSVTPYVFVHALTSTFNATDGTSLCDSATTCNAHGDCLNNNCVCDPGFTGTDCSQLVVFCQTGSCFNGGACSENPNRTYDDLTGMFANVFTCDCSATNVTGGTGPFLGQWCEIPPPCDQQPCLNGGICVVNDVTHSWNCDCSTTKSPNSSLPYTGDHCEVSQSLPCDNSPCQNGGVCSNHGVNPVAFATCDCSGTGGYIGTFCDLPPIDKCTATTCGPQGACYPSSAVATGFTKCVCTNGWSGAKCDVEPTVCQDKCQHGGTCYTLSALSSGASEAYACLCPAPWVGMNCQWNESQWNSASSSSVGILVLLFVALSALF